MDKGSTKGKSWFSKTRNSLQKWTLAKINKLPKPLKTIWELGKNTYQLFDAHDTSSLGAGLSFYMMFSIAPMLMIIVSVTGTIFGQDAVNGEVQKQIGKLLGANTAGQVQEMIKAAYRPGRNWIATIISVFLLITGAVGVFDQLRTSLNVVWDIKKGEKKPFFKYLFNRLFSFGMIICIALLLVISLIANAGIAALSGYIGKLIPTLSKVLLLTLEIIFSFGLTTILFAFIYRFMSDIKIKWRHVWRGAIFTSILFAAGKYLIGIYLSKSNLANTYGAASSVIMILLWVYYSSQIVFFGAEFTRALATQGGAELDSSRTTALQKAADEKRANAHVKAA